MIYNVVLVSGIPKNCSWRCSYFCLLPILYCLFFVIVLFELWYILEIKPLFVGLSANIFTHSVGLLFILFMVSFAVQKLASLTKFHLYIFAFISIALGD